MDLRVSSLSYSQLDKRFPNLGQCVPSIVEAINLISKSYLSGGKVIVFGNGGSSADAEHLCGELMKGFIKKRKLTLDERRLFEGIDPLLADKIQGALPAISLGVQHSTVSAFCNDMDPAYVYAQQVWGLCQKNDVAIGISTSGNSANVVNGIKVAKAKGACTIALTGAKDSFLSELSDVCIRAPEFSTYKIQELHLPIYHAICLEIENLFFKNQTAATEMELV
jgi:D-sedoheptulose 7-phosphate isomerase